MQLRIRRFVARGEQDHQQCRIDIHALHGPDIPDTLRPLRKRVHPLCRAAVRALRTDGQLPVRVAVRAGEQHLYADRTNHDYRTACQDRHSADRICRQTTVGRHDIGTGGIQCGKGSSAPHPDDRLVNGIRPYSADDGSWRGCQR